MVTWWCNMVIWCELQAFRYEEIQSYELNIEYYMLCGKSSSFQAIHRKTHIEAFSYKTKIGFDFFSRSKYYEISDFSSNALMLLHKFFTHNLYIQLIKVSRKLPKNLDMETIVYIPLNQFYIDNIFCIIAVLYDLIHSQFEDNTWKL